MTYYTQDYASLMCKRSVFSQNATRTKRTRYNQMLQQENWFDANTSAKEKGHHDLWTTKRKKIDDKFNHVTNLHKKHTHKMVNKK